MKITICSLLILLFSVQTIFAQTYLNPPEKPFIEITGSSELKVIPDEIYISITLYERQEKGDQLSITKQEKKMKEGLMSIGISMDDLSVADANSDYVKIKFRKKDVVSETKYTLLVHDGTTVGKVFEKLDELKIQNAYISKVDHSQMDSLRREVRIMAMKAAKEKADYMLNAIGENTGKPMIIREQTNTPMYRNTITNANESLKSHYNDEFDTIVEPVLQFQKIILTGMVYVKFEIQ